MQQDERGDAASAEHSGSFRHFQNAPAPSAPSLLRGGGATSVRSEPPIVAVTSDDDNDLALDSKAADAATVDGFGDNELLSLPRTTVQAVAAASASSTPAAMTTVMHEHGVAEDL